MPDIDALADSVFKAVESYLARSLETFEKRVDEAIAKRIAELPKPKDGEPGAAGKDADPEALAAIQSTLDELRNDSVAHTHEITAIEAKFAELPAPKDGEPGKDGSDGKDADLSAIEPFKALALDAMEAVGAIEKRIAELPAPKDGTPGKDGAPGRDGADGKDVDPTALADLDERFTHFATKDFEAFACANATRIESLEGDLDTLKAVPKSPSSFVLDDAGELVAVYPDGTTKAVGMVRGKDGARGASVMDGSVDESGQLMLRMSDGRIINAGIVKGAAGKDGVGQAGHPGRDANEIRVLPAIDESKSYPEGTTALYRGGMIRAERTTEPITDDLLKAGWRVALDGIAEESEQELDDGRIIERTTVYTSGRVFTRQTPSRALIWRGIWKDGDFRRGDVVTWDGSMWHCERDTKERPGGLTGVGDWKLCVKHGVPGKDGKSVKGDQGPPGRPGNDLTQMGFDGGKH